MFFYWFKAHHWICYLEDNKEYSCIFLPSNYRSPCHMLWLVSSVTPWKSLIYFTSWHRSWKLLLLFFLSFSILTNAFLLRYSKFYLHSNVFNISSTYRQIISLLLRAFHKTLKASIHLHQAVCWLERGGRRGEGWMSDSWKRMVEAWKSRTSSETG